jgi:hypothetical protein
MSTKTTFLPPDWAKDLHAFGNSLTVIKGNLEIALLYHEGELSADLKRLISDAYTETQQLKNLLARMAK